MSDITKLYAHRSVKINAIIDKCYNVIHVLQMPDSVNDHIDTL